MNQPFTKYNLDEENKKVDSFTVRINPQEREILDKSKQVLEQVKDSTALKQLAWIGANVIHEKKTTYLLATLFKNKRNNQRLNIVDFD